MDEMDRPNAPATPTRRQLMRAAAAGGLALGLAPLAVAACNRAPTSQRSPASTPGRATTLTVLHTADIHGQIDTHDEFFWEQGRATYRRAGGFARIQTLVDQVRSENPTGTVLVDGGDCIQGSGWVALSRGAVMAPLMRRLQYDVVIPGNWEVVYGEKQLEADIENYGAPVVCSNMFHDTGHGRGDYLFQPVHVKEVAGVRIGFLSFNDPHVPVRQDPVYSKGMLFTDPEVNAADWIRHLREKERCDLVFALTHMGIAQQYSLAHQPFMAGVDYILGADTHERIRTPLKGSVAQVTEPGAFGSFVGRLDLVMEKGKIKDATYDLIEVAERRYPEDEGMRQLTQQVKAPYRQQLDVVIGSTSTPLLRYFILETPMDNLITDALFESVQTELKGRGMPVDVALSNGFRFSPPLVPAADTGVASINRQYLWSMLPVNSTARVATVPGALVKPWMEKELNNVFAVDSAQLLGGWVVRMTGMTVNFTAGAPNGARVNRITIGDQPLDPNRNYVFAACERGGDPPDVLCRIKGVRDRFDLPFTLHDAVERYLRLHSPVSPKLEGRVTATDLPQTALGQLRGTEYQFL